MNKKEEGDKKMNKKRIIITLSALFFFINAIRFLSDINSNLAVLLFLHYIEMNLLQEMKIEINYGSNYYWINILLNNATIII